MQTQIREFISDNFLFGRGADLHDSDSLLEKGVVDSTGVLELIGFIETKFGVKVSDEEIVPENLDSIERISAFLGKKLTCR